MFGRNAGRPVMLSLAACALIGCASGSVTGSVTPRSQAASPLTRSWSSGLFGTTMLCRFNLLDGGAGMGGGGAGECQTSKGAKISARF